MPKSKKQKKPNQVQRQQKPPGVGQFLKQIQQKKMTMENKKIENFAKNNLGVEATATAKTLTKLLIGAMEATKNDDYVLTNSEFLAALTLLNDVLETI